MVNVTKRVGRVSVTLMVLLSVRETMKGPFRVQLD